MDALICNLSNMLSPVGQEQFLRDYIAEAIRPYVDDIRTDALGNLIARRRGKDPSQRLMLSAHMDEVGVMVTHIDDDGFLRFEPLGGLQPHMLLGQRFRFHNGTVGSVGAERLDHIKDLQMRRMFLDIGARSGDEARAKVRIGDAACFDQAAVLASDRRVIGKALDNRAGCAVLIQALQRIDEPACDLVAVFSTQEEVGARGAGPAAYAIEPTMAVALDVTPCGGTPKGDTLPVRMGDGAAIKVKDRSLLAHPLVKDHLTRLATEATIAYQYEVLPYGGTDAGAIHLSRSGVPTGVISIPCRYLHSPAEMVDLDDLEACVALTSRLIETNLPANT